MRRVPRFSPSAGSGALPATRSPHRSKVVMNWPATDTRIAGQPNRTRPPFHADTQPRQAGARRHFQRRGARLSCSEFLDRRGESLGIRFIRRTGSRIARVWYYLSPRPYGMPDAPDLRIVCERAAGSAGHYDRCLTATGRQAAVGTSGDAVCDVEVLLRRGNDSDGQSHLISIHGR